MSIDPVRMREILEAKTEHHMQISEEYSKACQSYATILSEWQRMLAIRIMTYKAKKSNLGIDMAVLFALADTEWEDREYFEKINQEANRLKYLRRGLERVIDACESEKITLMSLLKHDSDGEQFGG